MFLILLWGWWMTCFDVAILVIAKSWGKICFSGSLWRVRKEWLWPFWHHGQNAVLHFCQSHPKTPFCKNRNAIWFLFRHSFSVQIQDSTQLSKLISGYGIVDRPQSIRKRVSLHIFSFIYLARIAIFPYILEVAF